MPALSFKAKLLLAMLLVVIGVTGATLFVTQHQVQKTYRKLYAELLQAQNDAFTEKQGLVVDSFKQVCTTLVASPRLQAALSEATHDEPDDVYQVAKSEFETRGVIELDITRQKAFQASFYLFLDAKGQTLIPPESESFAHLRRLTNQKRFLEQLNRAGGNLSQLEQPLVGFISSGTEDGDSRLQQVILSRVIDTPTGESVGALALGFPMPDLGKTPQGPHELRAGILFDGYLYSQTIPPNQRDSLAQRVADQIRMSDSPPDDFTQPVGDDPNRVFYQALNPDKRIPMAHLVALVSMRDLIQTQRDLRGLILLFGGIGLAGAIILSYLLSHGLSGPIQELVKGTGEIQCGNFAFKVPIRSRDEIGQLAGSFNEMAQGLADKERYRSVLDKVSDKAIAEELIQGKVELGGEIREVSVLFCDIRGFTSLTQGMDPHEVIRMLNEHFTPLTRVVDQHKGVVDKFVGDLIMAFFGAPKNHGNDTYNSARCAIDMIRVREQLNETSKYKIKMGIGVASGPAVAGNMGSEDRLNYTVLGERVNLASRLCGKAGRMEVVIDETTRRRLDGQIVIEPMPELELKGFSSRILAYKLLDVLPLNTNL